MSFERSSLKSEARGFLVIPAPSILWEPFKVYHHYLVPKLASRTYLPTMGEKESIERMRRSMPANRKQGRLCKLYRKNSISFWYFYTVFTRGGSNPWKLYVAKFIFWFSWKRWQNFTFASPPDCSVSHWLNMELHLKSLFVLHVHSLGTTVLIGWGPVTPPPHLGSCTRAIWPAKIDDISMWLPVLPHCLYQNISSRLLRAVDLRKRKE